MYTVKLLHNQETVSHIDQLHPRSCIVESESCSEAGAEDNSIPDNAQSVEPELAEAGSTNAKA